MLDIVESGRHGVLYEEDDDVEALRDAIDKLPVLRSNFMNLRERAEQFSTEKFQSRLRALLDAGSQHGDITGS